MQRVTLPFLTALPNLVFRKELIQQPKTSTIQEPMGLLEASYRPLLHSFSNFLEHPFLFVLLQYFSRTFDFSTSFCGLILAFYLNNYNFLKYYNFDESLSN